MLAAPANRYAPAATLLPRKLGPIPVEPKPQLVACVDLAPGKLDESELYNAISRRHTNRSPYDPHKPIQPDFVDALTRLPGDDTDVKLFLFMAEADRKKIAELSSSANTKIYSDPDVLQGSERWVRTNWGAVQRFRDGLTIDAFHHRRNREDDDSRDAPPDCLAHRKERLLRPDVQRAADRVHCRARPVRARTVFAGRPNLAARASLGNPRLAIWKSCSSAADHGRAERTGLLLACRQEQSSHRASSVCVPELFCFAKSESRMVNSGEFGDGETGNKKQRSL